MASSGREQLVVYIYVCTCNNHLHPTKWHCIIHGLKTCKGLMFTAGCYRPFLTIMLRLIVYMISGMFDKICTLPRMQDIFLQL